MRMLLDETDEALRRGERPGSAVWPTGFDLLDTTLGGGLRAGELALLAGGEATGKTTLAVQVARNVVAQGRHAVVISFEHESHHLIQRLIALEAAFAAVDSLTGSGRPVDVTSVRQVFEADEPDRRGLTEAVSRLGFGARALAAVGEYSDRLHLHEADAQTTVEEVADIVAELIDAVGESPLVILDYLQKMPTVPEHADEGTRVTVVSELLKKLSLELDCPVLAISAAERHGGGGGQRMRARDLRGSPALAYEADVVLILAGKEDIVAREHLVYDLGSLSRFRRWSVLSVAKNRHGLGYVDLELEKDFEHGRFVPTAQVVAERLTDERLFDERLFVR
jgi:replicative DNA helicase